MHKRSSAQWKWKSSAQWNMKCNNQLESRLANCSCGWLERAALATFNSKSLLFIFNLIAASTSVIAQQIVTRQIICLESNLESQWLPSRASPSIVTVSVPSPEAWNRKGLIIQYSEIPIFLSLLSFYHHWPKLEWHCTGSAKWSNKRNKWPKKMQRHHQSQKKQKNWPFFWIKTLITKTISKGLALVGQNPNPELVYDICIILLPMHSVQCIHMYCNVCGGYGCGG